MPHFEVFHLYKSMTVILFFFFLISASQPLVQEVMDTESFVISFTHKLKPGNHGDGWTQCSDEARFTFRFVFRPGGVSVERARAVDSRRTEGSAEQAEARGRRADPQREPHVHILAIGAVRLAAADFFLVGDDGPTAWTS